MVDSVKIGGLTCRIIEDSDALRDDGIVTKRNWEQCTITICERLAQCDKALYVFMESLNLYTVEVRVQVTAECMPAVSFAVAAALKANPSLRTPDGFSVPEFIESPPFRYPVELQSDGLDDKSAAGDVRWAPGRIRVQGKCDTTRQWSILWHETIHAIARATHTRIQEDDVERLDFAVCMLIRDNPELIKTLCQQ